MTLMTYSVVLLDWTSVSLEAAAKGMYSHGRVHRFPLLPNANLSSLRVPFRLWTIARCGQRDCQTSADLSSACDSSESSLIM